jgi:hypothetical protein
VTGKGQGKVLDSTGGDFGKSRVWGVMVGGSVLVHKKQSVFRVKGCV